MKPVATTKRRDTDMHRIERLAIVSFGELKRTFLLAKFDESYGPVGSRISGKSMLRERMDIRGTRKHTESFSDAPYHLLRVRQKQENPMASSRRGQPARRPYSRRCLRSPTRCNWHPGRTSPRSSRRVSAARGRD